MRASKTLFSGSAKKVLINTLILLFSLYIVLCILLFFFQEKLIFFPEKLGKDFQFSFPGKFEEIRFQTDDHKLLNGVLFRADSSKGLIFYLHGNAGSINSWGEIAKTYTDLDYDILILDYRGYGKSEGTITSQDQLFRDLQVVYNDMKKRYNEDNVIVLGYSIGTAPAANIAASNNPKLLILQAPYYSLTDMMRNNYRIFPTFLLKYKFRTHQYFRDCKMSVVIFHGDKDEVIYYGSSLKLKDLMKESDTLITLWGQGHNGITDNPDYKTELEKILSFHNGKRKKEDPKQE